jgi:hypothetical protein
MASLGFQPLVFIGDEIRIATTGLAVSPAFCAQQPEVVAAMCACYQEALALIHRQAPVVTDALASAAVTVGGNGSSLAGVLRACYTPAGHSPDGLLQAGAERLARVLGLATPRPVAGLYDFSYLRANPQV